MVTWDPAAWLEYKKSCIGRNGAHQARLRVWENNLEIYREGGYKTRSGKEIRLDNHEALEGTRVYAAPIATDAIPTVPGGTVTGTGNIDCIELGRRALLLGYSPLILNFSGIEKPNGMVDKGFQAQEEAICRRTNLAQALSQYYTPEWAATVSVPHRENRYPLDPLHGSVYTPGVTVFRTGEFLGCDLLEEPFRLAFVSNGAIKKRQEADFDASDGQITRERIRTVFGVGLDRGHDCLILGGWGCGAFKNPVKVMAQLFKEVSMEPAFESRYRAVWFACLEKSSRTKDPRNGKFAPFYNLFGTLPKSVVHLPY